MSSTGRKLVVVINEAGKPYCDPSQLPRFMTTETMAQYLNADPALVASQLIRRGINPSAVLTLHHGNQSPLYTREDMQLLKGGTI